MTDLPAWLEDLSEADRRHIQTAEFTGTSLYAYTSGERKLSALRAIRVADMRIALGYPPRLHEMRPDIWGPADAGPDG